MDLPAYLCSPKTPQHPPLWICQPICAVRNPPTSSSLDLPAYLCSPKPPNILLSGSASLFVQSETPQYPPSSGSCQPICAVRNPPTSSSLGSASLFVQSENPPTSSSLDLPAYLCSPKTPQHPPLWICQPICAVRNPPTSSSLGSASLFVQSETPQHPPLWICQPICAVRWATIVSPPPIGLPAYLYSPNRFPLGPNWVLLGKRSQFVDSLSMLVCNRLFHNLAAWYEPPGNRLVRSLPPHSTAGG